MPTAADPNLHLIEAARAHIADGRLTEAAAVLNQARTQAPGDPRVYMMAGLMAERAGNIAGAFNLMQHGLTLAPNWAPGIVVLAQLQARQGQFPEARDNAASAMALDSTSRVVRDGAIDVAHLAGDLALARRHLEQGLEQFPNDHKYRLLLANDLNQLGEHDAALQVWNAMLANDPKDKQALEGRMHTLLGAARLDEAVRDTAALLALEPDSAVYAYYHARAKGETPPHQPAELNRQLFDVAAHVFDRQLVQGLRYRLPDEIAQRILALHPDRQLNLLDLGCGTGLLGARLGKIAGRMVGVDVSPKMLEQARRYQLYSHLEVADLHDTLAQAAPASYQVITMLDVCVYVGELGQAIGSAWQALAPGGHLFLSCESGPEDGPDLRLDPITERYVHKPSYVQTQCRDAGFTEVQARTTTLRYQKGQPVQGFVIQARRPA